MNQSLELVYMVNEKEPWVSLYGKWIGALSFEFENDEEENSHGSTDTWRETLSHNNESVGVL